MRRSRMTAIVNYFELQIRACRFRESSFEHRAGEFSGVALSLVGP